MKVRILFSQKGFQPTVDYSNSVFEMWLEAMVDQRSSQLGRVCRESHTCCFLKILQHHWFHFQMTLLAENLLTFLLIFLEEYLVVGLLVLVFGRLNSKIDLKQGFLFLFQCEKLLIIFITFESWFGFYLQNSTSLFAQHDFTRFFFKLFDCCFGFWRKSFA